jgi:hypothetical protein
MRYSLRNTKTPETGPFRGFVPTAVGAFVGVKREAQRTRAEPTLALTNDASDGLSDKAGHREPAGGRGRMWTASLVCSLSVVPVPLSVDRRSS